MSDLPDLDTSQAGLTAYYNIIDENPNVDSIEADSALTANRLTSYTLYENGFTGTMSSDLGSEWNVRLKNDGWLVIYLDRYESYNTRSSLSEQFGRGAIFKWSGGNSAAANNLTSAISQITDNLDSSGDIFYNGGDESLYDYEFSGASTIGVYSSYGDNFDFDVSDGTEIMACITAGEGNQDDLEVSLDGTRIAYSNGEFGYLSTPDIDPSVTHTVTVQYNCRANFLVIY